MGVKAPTPRKDPLDRSRPAGPWRLVGSGPRWGLWFMGWLFSWLPLWVAYLPAVALSPIYYLHFNPARYGTRLAMARMGLQLPGWRGLFAYANYALTLVDRYYIQAGRRTVSVEGPDGTAASLAPLEDFLRKADRLVLLGSHCGALELAAPAMEAAGRRVRAVAVADPGAALLLRGVGDVSEGVGVASRTIVADGTMESGLRMLGALRDGDALSFKADRVLPGNEDKSDPVDLFGTSVPLPRGRLRSRGSGRRLLSPWTCFGWVRAASAFSSRSLPRRRGITTSRPPSSPMHRRSNAASPGIPTTGSTSSPTGPRMKRHWPITTRRFHPGCESASAPLAPRFCVASSWLH